MLQVTEGNKDCFIGVFNVFKNNNNKKVIVAFIARVLTNFSPMSHFYTP